MDDGPEAVVARLMAFQRVDEPGLVGPRERRLAHAICQREIAGGGDGEPWEHYTGRVIAHEITHKLTGAPWLAPGYCMLSLGRIPTEISY